MIFKSSCDVSVANDMTAALATMRNQPVDAVTLDLQMPFVAGANALRALRSLDSDLEVIAITGFPPSSAAVREATSYGAQYVCKPFDVAHVREVVGRALRRRHRQNRRADDDRRVGTLSSELQQPLSTIRNCAAALKRGVNLRNLNAEQRVTVDRIQANVVVMEQLIDAAGILRGIQGGSSDVPRPCFDLSNLLRQTLTLLQPVASAFQCRVDLSAKGEVYHVHDAELTRLLLSLLLSTCLRHSTGGGLDLRLQQDSPQVATLTIDCHGDPPQLAICWKTLTASRGPGLPLESRALRHLVDVLGGSLHATVPAPERIRITLNLVSQPHPI